MLIRMVTNESLRENAAVTGLILLRRHDWQTPTVIFTVIFSRSLLAKVAIISHSSNILGHTRINIENIATTIKIVWRNSKLS